MVKESPPTRTMKDDESSSLKDNPHGLRRSAREAALRNQINSSSPKTRKSERLEKLSPMKSPVGKKPGNAQNATLSPSPLRRSERFNKLQPFSSSSPRNLGKCSGLNDLKSRSNQKGKSAKELAARGKEAKQLGQHDSSTACKKKKRMDARTYRAMLMIHNRKVKTSDSTKVRRLLEYSPVNSSNNSPDGLNEFQDERNGLIDSSAGRSSNVGVKCSKSDLKTSIIETLNSEDGTESSDSTLKDNCIKSDNVDLKISDSDFKDLSGCDFPKVEDGAGSSYSAKENNLMEVAKSVDGCGSQVSGVGNLSFPCTGAEDGKSDPKDRESMHINLFMTEKHRGGDVDIGMHQNSDNDDASWSNHRQVASNSKGDHMNLITLETRDCAYNDIYSSMADAIPSECSQQARCDGFKRKRVYDNTSAWPQSCCTQELIQVQCQDSVSVDRGDAEVRNNMLLINKCDLKVQQKDSCKHQDACALCKLDGELFRCSGKECQRTYHPLCLDPPLKDVYPGVWYCPLCVKRKIEFGVHAVSEGIESILGVREVEVLNDAGIQKQKQYFVKYKGLAHTHNLWIPESKLLHEAPELVLDFEQGKVTEWKQEWSLPHHILHKSFLKVPVSHDEIAGDAATDISNCQYEWLVKWCGLDYDNATWELQDASFFKTPEGQRAITDYETWNKTKETSEGFRPKISSSGLTGVDGNYLIFVSKLREYWHGRHNGFIINEQDQVAKIVYFVLSLQPEVSRPFLIITPCLLSSWEAEFLRLAPSIHVVAYSGSRETRKGIRKLEFQDSGCPRFQVLLSTAKAISEDLEALNCIKWEAIVVEDCQHPEIVVHSVDIKKLATDWRVLLANHNVKDFIPDYMNILSLLNSGGDADTLDSNHTISTLKESLSRHTLSGCKSQSSRFAEYWVPVYLSNLQLEQYSSILLSNSTTLRYCLKNDLGALREILVSTLKCCNHPYVLDPSLQPALTKGCTLDDIYHIGGKASGKLQLLDAILSELKNQGLRFLILYQPIGGVGRDSIGDILEDYLQYRFGTDSYERIDGFGYRNSSKQAACNNFNTEKARFILLLESRACLPSIKISAVDAVIIFNSDWNPLNDLRSLQKITIDSNSEQINVFRLYSFCTVEENILFLAKNGGNLHSISHNTNHMLLMLGASYLFSKLDVFHHDCNPDVIASIVSKDSVIKDVLQEVLSLTENHGKEASIKFISKTQHDGGKYLKDTSLLCELMEQSVVEELPHVFWAKLLDRREPRWKFLSTSSQRNRKRVQYFDSLPRHEDTHKDESSRKRKKVGRNSVDLSLKDGANAGERGFLTGKEKGISGTMTNDLPQSSSKQVIGNDLPTNQQVQMIESEEKRKLRYEQRQLLQLLNPEILKLCDVLQLPEDISKLAERFLEYVINHHRLIREPETILQAFLISVCWTAASLLSKEIDHKESFIHARECLNLSCKEDEAELVFSKMQSLKRVFLLQSEEVRPAYQKDPSSVPNSGTGETSDAKEAGIPKLEKRSVKDEVVSPVAGLSNKQMHSRRKTVEVVHGEILKKVKKIQKKCKRHMESLKEKQIRELEKLHQLWKEEKTKLENLQRVESMLAHSLYSTTASRTDMLKHLALDFAKKREIVERKMTSRLKDLQSKQQLEKNEEHQRTALWMEEVKAWARVQLSNDLLSVVSREIGGNSCEQIRIRESSNYADSLPGHPQDDHSIDIVESGEVEHHVELYEASKLAKCKVDFVASKTTVFAADENASGGDGTAGDHPSETQMAGGSFSDTLAKVPFMSELSNMRASQVLPALAMDEASIDKPLGVALVENLATAPREVHGSDPKERLNTCFPIEQDVNQIHSRTSNELDALEINNAGDSSLTYGEPTGVPEPVANTSMLQQQECGLQLCLPLEAVQTQVEAAIVTQNTFPEGEAPLQHHIDMSRHEPIDISVVAESIFVPPLLDNQQTVLSSDVNDNQQREHTPQQSILTSRSQNQYSAYSASHLNVVPCSISVSAGPPTGADAARSEVSLPTARSTHSNFSGILLQASSRIATQLPSAVTSDPLQDEYDRICREKDQVIRAQNEKMLRLISDCAKEIEEVVAEIRQKYDAMRQEAEASFLLKQKELEMNQNKVLMNKILAEAFRSKCLDYRVPAGKQQAAPSSNPRQLLQLQRPATQTASTTISGRPTSVNGPTTSHSGSVADRSPITLPSNPTWRPPLNRPPVITSISPAMGSQQQLMTEIRSPPPHLQPFRPAMSLPLRGLSTAVPGMIMPMQQASKVPSWSTPATRPVLTMPLEKARSISPSPAAPAQLPSRTTQPLACLPVAGSIPPVSWSVVPTQFPSRTPQPPTPLQVVSSTPPVLASAAPAQIASSTRQPTASLQVDSSISLVSSSAASAQSQWRTAQPPHLSQNPSTPSQPLPPQILAYNPCSVGQPNESECVGRDCSETAFEVLRDFTMQTCVSRLSGRLDVSDPETSDYFVQPVSPAAAALGDVVFLSDDDSGDGEG